MKCGTWYLLADPLTGAGPLTLAPPKTKGEEPGVGAAPKLNPPEGVLALPNWNVGVIPPTLPLKLKPPALPPDVALVPAANKLEALPEKARKHNHYNDKILSRKYH